MDDKARRQLTERLTLRITARLAERLTAAAADDDRTPSEFVRELLRRELARNEREAA